MKLGLIVKKLFLLFLITLAASALVGCSSTAPTAVPPSPTAPLQAETELAATALPATENPTAQPGRSLILLLIPPEASTDQFPRLQSELQALAAASNMTLETRTSLLPADISADVRLVVALPPAPSLADLAAAHPNLPFLSLAAPVQAAPANLYFFGKQTSGASQAAFTAGYMAAAITEDYRVGILSISDSEAGQADRQAFLNGAIFFCGLCRQTLPPYVNYPVYAELPASASPTEWQAAADTLLASAVKTVYVAPGVGDDSLLAYLAEKDANIIASTPMPGGLRDHWVASITATGQPGLEEVVVSLLNGQPLPASSGALTIQDTNPELLSPGRQALVEELMQQLADGLIVTH